MDIHERRIIAIENLERLISKNGYRIIPIKFLNTTTYFVIDVQEL